MPLVTLPRHAPRGSFGTASFCIPQSFMTNFQLSTRSFFPFLEVFYSLIKAHFIITSNFNFFYGVVTLFSSRYFLECSVLRNDEMGSPDFVSDSLIKSERFLCLLCEKFMKAIHDQAKVIPNSLHVIIPNILYSVV